MEQQLEQLAEIRYKIRRAKECPIGENRHLCEALEGILDLIQVGNRPIQPAAFSFEVTVTPVIAGMNTFGGRADVATEFTMIDPYEVIKCQA